MHNWTLYKWTIRTIMSIITVVSKYLPQWKETLCIEVFPPLLSIKVTLPVNHQLLPKALGQQFISVKNIPSRRIFILNNVYISGQAVVFKNCRIFIPSLTWLRDIDLFRKGDLFIKQWKQNIHKPESKKNYALVYDDWSAANYYHWMIEALPRLLMVQNKFPDAVLIVPEPAPEYITLTLAIMQYTCLYTLHRHPGSVLKVKKLVLPELVYYEEKEENVSAQDKKISKGHAEIRPGAMPFNYQQEELIKVVRNKLMVAYRDKPVIPSKRIYISRSRQKYRQLVNEQQLLPFLASNGFEIKYFEDMKFMEQIDMLFNTVVFVSVHGSNMVNILFMQKGSRVIELMNENYLNDAYYLLSSTFQLPYYAVPCKMADASINISDDSVKLNDADLVADTASLQQIIKTAIEVDSRL